MLISNELEPLSLHDNFKLTTSAGNEWSLLHDIHQNGIHQNGIQQNGIQQNGIQQNNIQQDYIKKNAIK